MQDKKYFIATKLAKKEIGFREVEDKDNQDKLKILQLKISESLEQIENFTNNSIKGMLTNNPDLDIGELETGIVFSLERKVSEGKITTLEDIKSPEMINAIQAEVMASNEYYVSSQITAEQVADSVVVGAIAGMTFAEFISKDMSQEEIVEFEKQFRASTEYKEAVVNNMDTLFDGQTNEEKENAAANVRLYELNKNSTTFLMRNKDNKLARMTAIGYIIRETLTKDPKLMKEAVIKAKMMGFDSMIKEDGSIDLELARIAMLELAEGDPKLLKRYSSQERFLEYFDEKNKRAGRVTLVKYGEDIDFKEQYLNSQSQEQKSKVIDGLDEVRAKRKEIMERLRAAIKSQNSDELQIRMAELADNNPDWAKEILLSMASKQKTAQPIQAEIVSFVNERFASKEDKQISNPLPKPNVVPKVASEGPDWEDR